jgi:hypothetical protein
MVKNPDISTNLRNQPGQKFLGRKRDMSGEKRMYGSPKQYSSVFYGHHIVSYIGIKRPVLN